MEESDEENESAEEEKFTVDKKSPLRMISWRQIPSVMRCFTIPVSVFFGVEIGSGSCRC